VLTRQPTNKFIQADEVGALAVYLASEGARSVTGTNVSIDGGWTAL
jgi:3-hydroxybutyrate dehydrogenase